MAAIKWSELETVLSHNMTVCFIWFPVMPKWLLAWEWDLVICKINRWDKWPLTPHKHYMIRCVSSLATQSLENSQRKRLGLIRLLLMDVSGFRTPLSQALDEMVGYSMKSRMMVRMRGKVKWIHNLLLTESGAQSSLSRGCEELMSMTFIGGLWLMLMTGRLNPRTKGLVVHGCSCSLLGFWFLRKAPSESCFSSPFFLSPPLISMSSHHILSCFGRM